MFSAIDALGPLDEGFDKVLAIWLNTGPSMASSTLLENS